ncbi:MAG: hypothetical protein R3F59_01505 [Myxococcota bacterium]
MQRVGVLGVATALVWVGAVAGCRPPGAGTTRSRRRRPTPRRRWRPPTLWDEQVDEAKLKLALDAYAEALKVGGADRHVLRA